MAKHSRSWPHVVAQWLIRHYPRAWRWRYGRELEQLVDDVGAQTTWQDVADLGRRLLIVWLESLVMSLVRGSGQMALERDPIPFGGLVRGLVISWFSAFTGMVTTGAIVVWLLGGEIEMQIRLSAHPGRAGMLLGWMMLAVAVTLAASVTTFLFVGTTPRVRRIGWIVLAIQAGYGGLLFAAVAAGVPPHWIPAPLFGFQTDAWQRLILAFLPLAVAYALAAGRSVRMWQHSSDAGHGDMVTT
jgi:hypothetical protein